jgi:hypothetical protein
MRLSPYIYTAPAGDQLTCPCRLSLCTVFPPSAMITVPQVRSSAIYGKPQNTEVAPRARARSCPTPFLVNYTSLRAHTHPT